MKSQFTLAIYDFKKHTHQVKAGSLRRAAAVRKQLSESLRSALASETVDPDGILS